MDIENLIKTAKQLQEEIDFLSAKSLMKDMDIHISLNKQYFEITISRALVKEDKE